MNLSSLAFWRKQDVKPEPKSGFVQARRGFDAATIDRLTSDWLSPQTSADTEIASTIRTTRGRSRELERNNEYVQRYLCLLENNVLGSEGVRLQMKIADFNGKLDDLANKIVLDGWKDWSRRGNCTVSKNMCWRDVEGMVMRRTPSDGGILIRKVTASNKYKFSIQLLEIDHLDLDYTAVLRNGNEVRLGVEYNEWKEAIALYLLSRHPGDVFIGSPNVHRMRVPTSEIIHAYWSERPGQTIGVPWYSCVMLSLRNLGKYAEAEVMAARVGACMGIAITQEKPSEWTGPTDSNGQLQQEMAPGMGLFLNPGEDVKMINPSHPNQVFPEFMKGTLRGIAAGLGINYNSLANDLESVNYSSMRAGKLEEVEEYKGIQSWLIETLHQPIFEAWLESALMWGALVTPSGATLPLSKFDKFNAPDWKPRRWPWVDPLKDLQAAVLKVEKGFGSRRSIIAEMGGDVEEVFAEQKADNELAEANDLEFPLDKAAPQINEPTADGMGGNSSPKLTKKP